MSTNLIIFYNRATISTNVPEWCAILNLLPETNSLVEL